MTKRRGLVDVEPLSDRRWAEVERGVLDRLDQPVDIGAPPERRPRPALVAIGAGIAIAAALAIGYLGGGSDGDGSRRLATSRVTSEASVAQTTAGDATIEIAPFSSVLVIEQDRDAWLVAIEHGSARFRVPPRAGRAPFAVEAGNVRVEVVGTRFVVAREPGSASATVEVEEGTVRVIARGDESFVHAGERWPSLVPAASAAQDDEREIPAVDIAAAEIDTAEIGAAREIPAAEIPVADRRADTIRTARVAPRDEPNVPVVTPPEAVGPSARERFAHAESLEGTTPQIALTEYAALAAEGGPWGANALFAQGRLELELRHTERARALLERYLAGHPGGVNAEDARRLLDGMR